jgi:ribosomal protein S6
LSAYFYMATYELMVLAPVFTADSSDAEEMTKAITAIVTKVKGKVTSQEEMGEKVLAYEINHQNQGLYLVYRLELPTSEIKSVTKRLKQVKNVWRFLLTRLEEKQ